MKYPEIFIMSDLLEMTSDELQDLDDALFADWQRVRKAKEVKRALEEENMVSSECNGCGDYICHPNDIEKKLCHWCQPEQKEE
jgi:hypothetical protein